MKKNISLESIKQFIQNRNITIELDGIIVTTIEFKKINVEIEEEIFRILGANNCKFEIKIIQVISINKIKQGTFEFITDQLEKVIIKCH